MELNDWNVEELDKLWSSIQRIGKEKYNLNFYKPAFELVTFEDMIRIYSAHLPISYSHWSFGKAYLENSTKYKANMLGIALEVIFNTNPALCQY